MQIRSEPYKLLLGHADIRVTFNTYTDVFDSHRDDEVAKLTEYMKKMQLIDGKENSDEKPPNLA